MHNWNATTLTPILKLIFGEGKMRCLCRTSVGYPVAHKNGGVSLPIPSPDGICLAVAARLTVKGREWEFDRPRPIGAKESVG